MSSTFGGINTAYSALVAQRRALDVAGQNLANANTPGYSRQRVTMESVGGPATAARWSTYDGAGQGVRVTDTTRMLDVFAQQRAQAEHGTDASLTQQASTLSGIENQLVEPSDTGIKTQLEAVWNSLEEVSNQPGVIGLRSALLQNAETLAGSLRSARGALDGQWQDTRAALTSTVTEVNATAKNVADLNAAIRKDTLAGVPANELADQRDALVATISKLTGATSRNNDDGTVDVYVAGSSLVRGDKAESLYVTGTSNSSLTGSDPVTVRRSTDGNPAGIASGTAAGALQGLNSTIPAYATKLDGFATQLATAVNTVHRTGYDLDPAGDPPTGGEQRDFFASTDGNPITAANITVGITDPRKVAASATPGGNLGGDIATAMANIAVDPTGPEATYASLVVGLGSAVSSANTRSAAQAAVVSQADAAVSSVSGVDMDEEMANMLMYQHAYEAAARVLTTVDSTLDTLINRTGLVGR